MRDLKSARRGIRTLVLVACAAMTLGAAAARTERVPDDDLPVIQATAIPLTYGDTSPTAIDVTTLYLNEGTAQFKYATNPAKVLEEITLNAVGMPLTSIEFKFAVISPTNVRVEVRLWDGFNPAATPVNSAFLGGANYDFGDLAIGNYSSGTLPLPAVPAVTPADDLIAIQFDYRNPTNGLLTTATMLFAGNGVTVGDSPETCYMDVDNDGVFEPTENVFFGSSPPNLLNSYLHLRGVFPYTAEPGYDLYTTPPGTSSFDFSTNPLPDNFFGLGSIPFAGKVLFRGEPFPTSPGNALYPTDTIIRRLDSVLLSDPNASGNTRIEVTAMSLRSTTPITVEFFEPPHTEQWDVDMSVSLTKPPFGNMTITKGPCEGGIFTGTLNVMPRFVFRRVGGGGVATLDYGAQGLPHFQYPFQGHWLNVDPNFALRIPTTDVQVGFSGSIVVTPPTTPFFPGLRVERCGGACAAPGFTRMRAMHLENAIASQILLLTATFPSDSDLDALANNVDNCPSIYNPFQDDSDDDTVGDDCDNCAMVCNVDQADSDMDGRGNVCEVPEIPTLSLSGARRATLAWPQVAPPEVYDILKSDSKNLSVGTECLRQNYPVNNVDDTAIPNFGQIRYYLPRVVNGTGAGPWGYSSAGAETMSSVCNGGGTTCRDAIDYLTATVPPPGPGATVTFCAPAADCIPGGTPLSRSRASDKLCQNVYGAACATHNDCTPATGCCADKVTGSDLTLGTCAAVVPDTCAGTDVRCNCGYTVPPDPAPPAVGFRCDCVCQAGACPPP